MIKDLVYSLDGIKQLRTQTELILYKNSEQKNVDIEEISTNVWWKICVTIRNSVLKPISDTTKQFINNIKYMEESIIEIDLADWDPQILYFLIKESCEKNISVNKVIENCLNDMLNVYQKDPKQLLFDF